MMRFCEVVDGWIAGELTSAIAKCQLPGEPATSRSRPSAAGREGPVPSSKTRERVCRLHERSRARIDTARIAWRATAASIHLHAQETSNCPVFPLV